MRIPVYGLVLVLVGLGVSATAQTTLSEAEALARLSAESPRVRAIRSGIEVAEAEVGMAGRWPNPRVTTTREAAAGVSEVLSTVLQSLPVTGVRTLERRAASELVGAATSRADQSVRRVRAELRQAFGALLAAQAREEVCVQARDRLRSLAGVIARREAAGEAAGFDRLRVEREVLEVETDCQIAAVDRTRAQGGLAGFLSGSPDPATLVAQVPTTRSALPADPVALVARAEAVPGELAALRHDGESARLSALAADRRRLPVPEIVAGTKTSSDPGGAGGLVGSIVGVQVVVPLFDTGRAERGLAEARARQAHTRIEAYRQALRTQVLSWREVAAARRAAAERYRASASASADEVERIAQVSYDAGERGILEVLDAARAASAARSRQVTLDMAAREAEIELEYLAGSENP